MDAKSIAHMTKNVNFLANSTTRSVRNAKPFCNNSTLFYHQIFLNFSSIATQCSTTPNIDSDNVTDKNPIVEPKLLDSKTQLQVTPTTSNEALDSDSNVSSTFSPSPSSSSRLRGLVFALGSLNSWDDAEIGSPVVKRFISDDEERWYMWYHGKSTTNGTSMVGLAISSNGIHWERGKGLVESSTDVGLVMKCSEDWWAFDTSSIMPSEIVIMSSSKVRVSSAVYWLYYTGFSSEIVENLAMNDGFGKVFKSLPGLAISQDGRYWARIEGDHHSGALLEMGSEGDWDSTYIASPQVVYHKSGDLRMYYHSYDAKKGEYAIGMARSRDGMKWVKLGKILGSSGLTGSFDEFGVTNACVARNKKDGNYVMAYDGVGCDGKRSIGLAISSDGLLEWRRLGSQAILETSSDDDDSNEWDCREIGSPCLVQMELSDRSDEWRLYYRGVGNDGKNGIGMAICDGVDLTCFTKWTGFHL